MYDGAPAPPLPHLGAGEAPSACRKGRNFLSREGIPFLFLKTVSSRVCDLGGPFWPPPGGRDLARMSPQSPAFEPQSIVQIRPMAARLVAKFGFQKKTIFREIPSGSLHLCLLGMPTTGAKASEYDGLCPRALERERPAIPKHISDISTT